MGWYGRWDIQYKNKDNKQGLDKFIKLSKLFMCNYAERFKETTYGITSTRSARLYTADEDLKTIMSYLPKGSELFVTIDGETRPLVKQSELKNMMPGARYKTLTYDEYPANYEVKTNEVDKKKFTSYLESLDSFSSSTSFSRDYIEVKYHDEDYAPLATLKKYKDGRCEYYLHEVELISDPKVELENEKQHFYFDENGELVVDTVKDEDRSTSLGGGLDMMINETLTARDGGASIEKLLGVWSDAFGKDEEILEIAIKHLKESLLNVNINNVPNENVDMFNKLLIGVENSGSLKGLLENYSEKARQTQEEWQI